MRPTLFTNAVFITLEGDSRHGCMAVEDGRITALGSPAELAPLKDRGFVSVDLGGGFALPGFHDCHSHLILTGIMTLGLDLSAARSLEEVRDRVRDAARALPAGEFVRGFLLEDLNLRDGRPPLRADLDAAAPRNPVLIIHPTCHRAFLNTAAVAALGLPPDLPGLDMENGAPTGVVRDPGVLTHVFPAMMRSMSRAHLDAACAEAARRALAVGLTSVQSMEGGELTPGCAPVLLENAARLPLRVTCWNQSMDFSETVALGLPRIGGCICADGELDARTAALFEPYSDDPGNRGALLYSDERMEGFVREAHGRGLQIAMHCESERSIEQVLAALEKALADEPRADHRHRIEHFELPAWDQIERMARAGVTASMQPAFLPEFLEDGRLEHSLGLFGPERVRRLHPYRAILDAGVRVCGGSDSPVTSYNPLFGIRAAAAHGFPEQSANLREAVEMFTVQAARSVFRENDLGTLAAGRLADFVVLDRDILAVRPEDVPEITVRKVFVGGEERGG
ncbi:MAG: amidohydrolase [Desulfovibrio aminophilus]|uniref:amidohydrolase n=1 Tax=Desulfovibrio aminophilus TaxID=81425 RepID=UPI0039E91B5B